MKLNDLMDLESDDHIANQESQNDEEVSQVYTLQDAVKRLKPINMLKELFDLMKAEIPNDHEVI